MVVNVTNAVDTNTPMSPQSQNYRHIRSEKLGDRNEESTFLRCLRHPDEIDDSEGLTDVNMIDRVA